MHAPHPSAPSRPVARSSKHGDTASYPPASTRARFTRTSTLLSSLQPPTHPPPPIHPPPPRPPTTTTRSIRRTHHLEHAAPRDGAVVCALRLPGLAALAEARPARVPPVKVVVGVGHALQLGAGLLWGSMGVGQGELRGSQMVCATHEEAHAYDTAVARPSTPALHDTRVRTRGRVVAAASRSPQPSLDMPPPPP